MEEDQESLSKKLLRFFSLSLIYAFVKFLMVITCVFDPFCSPSSAAIEGFYSFIVGVSITFWFYMQFIKHRYYFSKFDRMFSLLMFSMSFVLLVFNELSLIKSQIFLFDYYTPRLISSINFLILFLTLKYGYQLRTIFMTNEGRDFS